MKNHLTLMLLIFCLSGCASRIPPDIRATPSPNPMPLAVTSQPHAYQNQPVRWGGSILSVINHEKDTEIEILAKELDDSGKPVESDTSLGRFLARTEGFVDPAIYAQGRSVTVYGTVESVVSREIGEKPYSYPVVRVKTLYLWPREPDYIYPAYYPYGFPYWYYPYGFRYGIGMGYIRR